jgi:hypothetical protein
MSMPKDPAKQPERLPDSELDKVSGGDASELDRAMRDSANVDKLAEKALERISGGTNPLLDPAAAAKLPDDLLEKLSAGSTPEEIIARKCDEN